MKKLKRGPISLEALEVDELGTVLEVQTKEEVHQWRKGSCPLFWCPRTKALIWVQGGRRGRKMSLQAAHARSVYQKWHDKNPQFERIDTIPTVKNAAWRRVGTAIRTDYYSTKWGKKDEYTHDHGRGVGLYCYGATKGAKVWVLKGGNLRVTARGIQG